LSSTNAALARSSLGQVAELVLHLSQLAVDLEPLAVARPDHLRRRRPAQRCGDDVRLQVVGQDAETTAADRLALPRLPADAEVAGLR
jgi:hypothetical protein